jgi:archaellin
MSQYYNPHRSSSWNYGGKNWKLSRSKIDLFLECPKCFYLDNKLGIKRPPGYPFTINSAIDYLLKQEFDILRAENKQHPLIESYGIDARPAVHKNLDEWRDNFKGVQHYHQPTQMTVTGAIDDLWINSSDEYIVVDYKSTAVKDSITELNKDWHEDYKRQMDIYQWLLRQNGYQVCDTGYFLYANGITDKEAFDAKLEFELTLIPYVGSTGWIEETLLEIKACLESDEIPEAAEECDYCAYREAVREVSG